MKEWVYLVTNPVMPNLVKLGYSSKDPDTRKAKFEQQNTALPANYEFQYKGLMENAFQVESKAHQILEQYRYTSTKFVAGNEWFECDLLTALNAIRQASQSEIVYEEFYNDLEQLLNNQDDDLDEDFDLEKYEQELRNQITQQKQQEEENSRKQQLIKEQKETKELLANALNGDVDAQYQLGKIYLEGNLAVRQNLDKAKEWFEQSANTGYAKAQCELGNMYFRGTGVPQNIQTAIYYYILAKKQNLPAAIKNLDIAQKTQLDTRREKNAQIQVEPISKEQQYSAQMYFNWKIQSLESMANKGDSASQYHLARMYLSGDNLISPNRQKARAWFQKAAQNNNKLAIKQLAKMDLEENNTTITHNKPIKQDEVNYLQRNNNSDMEEKSLNKLFHIMKSLSKSEKIKLLSIIAESKIGNINAQNMLSNIFRRLNLIPEAEYWKNKTNP